MLSRNSSTTMLFILAAALFLPLVGRAENVMQISDGEGKPGDLGIEVIVTATTDTPIHGYSIALNYPEEALTLRSIGIQGTDVGALEPEFVAPLDHLGVATLGVILDFEAPVAPIQLAATGNGAAPHILARLVFDIRPDAPGGDFPLELRDGIGSPAAFNRFTQNGVSIAPELTSGRFLVEGGNVLTLERKRAIAGATPALPVLALAQYPEELRGFSISIAYDCGANVLQLSEATVDGTDLGFLLGSRIEFFGTRIDDTFSLHSNCRSLTGAVFDFFPPEDPTLILPPAPDEASAQSLMRYTFRVGMAADDVTEFQDLILENLANPVEPNNIFFIGQESVSVRPRLVHGKIYFSVGDLTGRVLDAVTGEGVRGLTVTLDPRPCPDPVGACRNPVTTNATGNFLFEGIIPGTYTVKLSGTGYYTARHPGIEVAGRGAAVNAGELGILRVPTGGPRGTFLRGDSNNDGRADLSDSIYILSFLFQGGPAFPCPQAADANNDNRTDISDAIWMLAFFFTGGPSILPPYPNCGTDPDSGPLGCPESRCN